MLVVQVQPPRFGGVARGFGVKKITKKMSGYGEGHVLGDRTFAAISAVEGINLSASSRKRLESMKKRKLTTEEQRTEIIRAYTDAKSR